MVIIGQSGSESVSKAVFILKERVRDEEERKRRETDKQERGEKEREQEQENIPHLSEGKRI